MDLTESNAPEVEKIISRLTNYHLQHDDNHIRISQPLNSIKKFIYSNVLSCIAMSKRYVTISQDELRNIRELYEGVMSQASHGLFFKEGSIIGIGIASIANRNRESYFETCRRILIEKNWVKDVEFKVDDDEHIIITMGSIEVSKNDTPTCHRLRGILRKIYEVYLDKKVYCREIECESTGSDKCVFKVETSQSW